MVTELSQRKRPNRVRQARPPWPRSPRTESVVRRTCHPPGKVRGSARYSRSFRRMMPSGEVTIEALLFTMAAAPAFDDDFVARLRKGDGKAFEELLDEYHGALYRFARSFGASTASAEEIVQETWLAVIEGIDRFEGRSSLKTWIFAILANQARRRATRDKRMPPLSSLFSDEMVQSIIENQENPCPQGAPTRTYSWSINPGDRAEQQALLEVIRDAVATLPESQRAVLILRDFEGLSPDDACEILGVTDGNHRVLLHRARNVVRAAVTEYYEQIDGEGQR